MNDTVLFPSPNWFQTSGIGVSPDGWLIYGGPSKSLCVLKPFKKSENLNQCYQAQVLNRAHNEKIVSVDITPEWPEKRYIVAGSADGIVKQWSFSEVNNSIKIKFEQSHDIHHSEKEEVVGVGYSNETFVLTVGNFGNIVKWDVSSNIAKSFNTFLKSFKPTCLACSPHILLNVAVGTRQGVVFVLDLNGTGKVLYKVRGQNEEIVNVSWCPKYDVLIKRSLEESEKRSHLSDRLAKIRLEGEVAEGLNKSGVTKDLPEDSFDESIVQEDDMFDIYKDHEEDEFGHRKYKPEMIVVKTKKEKDTESDFLADCMKLKEDLLKIKNASEDTIEDLVDAMDKAHVSQEISEKDLPSEEKSDKVEVSCHPHKHLLASIGKQGGVRIWSKSGKLVASCAVATFAKNQKSKIPAWATLLWYKAETLLIADGKSQLLTCNPLKLDCKNKLEWKVEHSLHKRGLFCIASNAPKMQSSKTISTEQSTDSSENASSEIFKNKVNEEDWIIWSASQDRNLVCYSVEKHEALAMYNSCGGYVYDIESCPYDARQVAISVGDGAVRIWEADIDEDDPKLFRGTVYTYWQNVQGKVLTIAWHPTSENLLAFGTAESRVGLIDTGGKTERPARTLVPALRGGVYSLCWGLKDCLYACGGGELVVYHTKNINEDPTPITVEIEGKKWELTSVRWHERGVLVGSGHGGVALLSHTHEPIAAAFIFSKMIHHMDWHPQQTSSSNEESPYKNLIAVSSLDKQNNIIILEHDEKEVPKLLVWKTLTGHKGPVLQVSWNPHIEELLLSTSQDSTVRIWDIATGVCTHIMGSHTHMSLGGAWSGQPARARTALSGGADCALRAWPIDCYPADRYQEVKHELLKDKKKKKEKKAEDKSEDISAAIVSDNNVKSNKKFLLPTINGQMYPLTALKIRKMAEICLNNADIANGQTELETGSDFIRMFGNTNDVNAVLDLEMKNHLEHDRLEAWIMISILRGEMSAMIEFANQSDMLCPFLVSLAPCVSFKYWKDTMQLYLAQIDRKIAKGEKDKPKPSREYGGVIFRKVALLLSVHDVKKAVQVLTEARLFKEAYLLSRTRHMDSIAEETLKMWAVDSIKTGMFPLASLCYIALNDAYQAAIALSKINSQEYLNLAADLAKMAGQVTFAEHIDDKIEQIHNTEETEDLKPLPSRTELLTELSSAEDAKNVNNVTV
ncbi:uncharacterized protein LOC119833454 isoform X2 [Zerene cesonia]|uniref:uncharacterized protein LOC119833454 isoform X2 n=1 Tax=Zerene cesonia TaxID=33412 RepID=UPI0018E50737|nr:uncharacterized protein LOC119833454 isoform X2 [Zerene cesonia]